MKKIILDPLPSDTITLSEVQKHDYPIVGVKYYDKKATLHPVKYKSNTYRALCVNAWEMGNTCFMSPKDEGTIQEWCEYFVKSYNAEIFLFDSTAELFQWMAE